VPFEAPLREVEAAMRGLGGRPHWGKHSWTTAAQHRDRYPRWDAFAAARAQLDPGGRFANAFTERTLGSQEAAPLAPVGGDRPDQIVPGE
jgi:L-gulono-1,4-lactone dehydrogenase